MPLSPIVYILIATAGALLIASWSTLAIQLARKHRK